MSQLVFVLSCLPFDNKGSLKSDREISSIFIHDITLSENTFFHDLEVNVEFFFFFWSYQRVVFTTVYKTLVFSRWTDHVCRFLFKKFLDRIWDTITFKLFFLLSFLIIYRIDIQVSILIAGSLNIRLRDYSRVFTGKL